MSQKMQHPKRVQTNMVQLVRLFSAGSLALLFFIGCMSAADETSLDGSFNNGDVATSLNRQAQNFLFEHNVQRANATYEELLDEYPNDAEAAAGKAITDILLIPYSPEFTNVIVSNLGASRPLGATKDVVYSEGGLLYLLARGVPFEDGSSFPGIRSLLVDDLPWTTLQLETLESFVDGLNKPVSVLFDSLSEFADSLEHIEQGLDAALQNSNFESIFIPGEVFHHKNLSLSVTTTEIAALRALVSGVRTLIYFGSAYSWSFSPDEAFGSRWNEIMEGDDGYVQGYEADDYIVSFLDAKLFRVIRRPDDLARAEASFKNFFRYVGITLELGLLGETSGELNFSSADSRTAGELQELAAKIEASPDGPVVLPFSVPETSMSLSSFFGEGRVLEPETPWMSLIEDQDGVRTWELGDEAYVSFFVEGVFTPDFNSDTVFEFQFSSDSGEFGGTVTDPLFDDVEDAYLSGR